jgi:hypothetical protein
MEEALRAAVASMTTGCQCDWLGCSGPLGAAIQCLKTDNVCHLGPEMVVGRVTDLGRHTIGGIALFNMDSRYLI